MSENRRGQVRELAENVNVKSRYHDEGLGFSVCVCVVQV